MPSSSSNADQCKLLTLARILTATSAPQYSASHTSPKLPSPTHSTSRMSAGDTARICEVPEWGRETWFARDVALAAGQGRETRRAHAELHPATQQRCVAASTPLRASKTARGAAQPSHQAPSTLTLQKAGGQLGEVGGGVCVDAATRRAALDHSEARPPPAAALLALPLAQAGHLAPRAQLQERSKEGGGGPPSAGLAHVGCPGMRLHKESCAAPHSKPPPRKQQP